MLLLEASPHCSRPLAFPTPATWSQPKEMGLPVHAYVAKEEIREDGTEKSKKVRWWGHLVLAGASIAAWLPPDEACNFLASAVQSCGMPLHRSDAVWHQLSQAPPAPLLQVFANLPTEVGATEAEEIGVEHLLRDVKDAAVSTLASEVGTAWGNGQPAGWE